MRRQPERREVVVVTGASAGVGRATVREFAMRGARVGLLARDRRRLETAAGEVEALGGESIVCVCDVADPAQVEAAADRVEEALVPRRPRPPAPLYQPEVAARAIYWAAHHHRRQLVVAWPTALAIVADKIFPALADRHLAKTGYESQQSDQPARDDRRDNLFATVPGDFGAHGDLDSEAKPRSLELWLVERRRPLAAALAIGAAAWLGWRLLARDRASVRPSIP